jgi:hypothetical protein
MRHFEVLTGLPPYGPPAERFSATGQGTHREGFVVRFTDSRGRQWVGNFQAERTCTTPGLKGRAERAERIAGEAMDEAMDTSDGPSDGQALRASDGPSDGQALRRD